MVVQTLFPQTKPNFRSQIAKFLPGKSRLRLRYPGLCLSLVAAGLCVGVRHLGWLQPLELIVFDSLVQLQPSVEADPRILIVGITEADIQRLEQWPMSDRVLAEALANLQANEPKVVGLDIYRDIPQEPGHQDLLAQLKAANLIAIETFGSVPAPPSVPPERVGFNDVVLDSDGIVRRNLMAGTADDETFYSFALRISQTYLGRQDFPVTLEDDRLNIGDIPFKRLGPNAGSYQDLDSAGHQIMLKYRPATPVARQLSLTQVLEKDFQPEWVQGKIVLIGATADSAKDSFLTPFTRMDAHEALTPGVTIHAHMVSQFLSTVLDNQRPIWFIPEWAEMSWILVWAMAGGLISWKIKHPLALAGCNIIAIGGLGLINYGVFLQAGWLPTIAPIAGLVASQGLIISYKRFYDSTHDVLTGLLNRENFIKQLKSLITSSAKANSRYAVLFLSLKRFNVINESFGFDVGDEVLCIVVERIQKFLKGQGKIARVGTDEFALFIHNIQAVQDVRTLADRINQEIELPVDLHGKVLFLTSSIGIALNQPDSSYLPEDLMRDAHTAMYRAKSQGKSHYEVFALGMHQEKLVRMQLESDLHYALERQEFYLNYQPIISLKTGKIIGFEALVRWQHPEKGFISPGDFIPVAEETGLIVPLGRWIMQTACEQIAVWQAEFCSEIPLMMSINLSPGQFFQPNLIEQIDEILHATQVTRKSVKFEITETMVMDNVQGAIDLLLRLKELDIKLGLDDFGTGYSSLSYLSRFPIDTLKIDRSFVNTMHQVSNDLEVVRTIISLGHNLGMDIIAEGVEEQAQLTALADLDCEYAQGFFMSKPVAANLATDLLKANQSWPVRQSFSYAFSD